MLDLAQAAINPSRSNTFVESINDFGTDAHVQRITAELNRGEPFDFPAFANKQVARQVTRTKDAGKENKFKDNLTMNQPFRCKVPKSDQAPDTEHDEQNDSGGKLHDRLPHCIPFISAERA